MSDEQSQESPTDSSSSPDDPGGGPQRVVSEQSVDDILDSLGEPADEPADSSDIDDTPVEDDTTASTAVDPQKSDETPLERDEQTNESTAAGNSRDIDASSSEPSNDDSDGDDASNSSDDSVSGADADDDEDEPFDSSNALSQTGSVESVNEDTSIDDLAARIERGDVTGSDVRAAEAGDGRESTRDVGEIDLSMDDLESTQATSGASPTAGTDSAADDGPLAGSIDPTVEDSSGDEESDTSGFLGRIKRFFGG